MALLLNSRVLSRSVRFGVAARRHTKARHSHGRSGRFTLTR